MSVAVTAKGKNLFDKIPRALTGAADFLDAAGNLVRNRDPSLRNLGIAEDRPNDIVEIMRDATGEGADRLHAPGLFQPGFEPRPFLFQRGSIDRVRNGIK